MNKLINFQHNLPGSLEDARKQTQNRRFLVYTDVIASVSEYRKWKS